MLLELGVERHGDVGDVGRPAAPERGASQLGEGEAHWEVRRGRGGCVRLGSRQRRRGAHEGQAPGEPDKGRGFEGVGHRPHGRGPDRGLGSLYRQEGSRLCGSVVSDLLDEGGDCGGRGVRSCGGEDRGRGDRCREVAGGGGGPGLPDLGELHGEATSGGRGSGGHGGDSRGRGVRCVEDAGCLRGLGRPGLGVGDDLRGRGLLGDLRGLLVAEGLGSGELSDEGGV